jgi:hypothetical protein
MGKKKSQEFHWLLQHLIIQFMIVYLGGCFLMDPRIAFRLSLLNAAIHGIIDWNIWRLYKLNVHYRIKKDAAQYGNPQEAYDLKVKGWQYWEDHYFYATIGLDQGLHSITLVLLAGWLT